MSWTPLTPEELDALNAYTALRRENDYLKTVIGVYVRMLIAFLPISFFAGFLVGQIAP